MNLKLNFIIARDRNIAAIIRRGPSKLIQLSKWDIDNNKIEKGQWFKGVIRAESCDLSPDGKLFIYVAEKYKKGKIDPTISSSWTAISKLPYLTALTLWPINGYQVGGGIFHDDNNLELFHLENNSKYHKKFSSPKLKFELNNSQTGYSYLAKLKLNGWKVTKSWDQTTRSDLREKILNNSSSILLERIIDYHGYRKIFYLKINDSRIKIENADCVDVDGKSRLIISKDGKLFISQPNNFNLDDLVEVADFNSEKFEEVETPNEFKYW